ncbi:AEC family transporter [Notoacmeibacter sp. MSK16QG-6]|uniref:AEC family transporter n=1 Tax=Notoacmeibacter sp. MSK16QG-6 TaxID=2957982 RepID=UPI0020A152EA|nr:AEC family transporter [Notoacmeibacter sp. MSK16QG-6]MCP1199298.1 AEC family transporter [Notoacmeibacter sp. MSK16QG-6]
MIAALWPVFALIMIGFLLRRASFPDPAFWPAAEKLNYFLLFPALLILSLSKAPLDDPAILNLGGAILITILIVTALTALAARIRGWNAARHGPLLQGLIRFNTYLGLAIAGNIGGQEAISRAAALLAIAVPTVNVLSVLALAGERGVGAKALVRPLLTNPLIIACLIGIGLSLSRLGMPPYSEEIFDFLAQSSLPLGLLCVGAALKPAAARRETVTLLTNSVARLLAVPALAFAIGTAMSLASTDMLVLITFTAIPTAATAYVLTTQMKGDGTLMAGITTAQTVMAALTLPLVLYWFV